MWKKYLRTNFHRSHNTSETRCQIFFTVATRKSTQWNRRHEKSQKPLSRILLIMSGFSSGLDKVIRGIPFLVGGAGRSTAGYCHVDGKKFARGRPFSFDQDCFRFRCMCNRDGSWNCPSRDTENICGGEETAGRTSSSGSGSSIRDSRVEKTGVVLSWL